MKLLCFFVIGLTISLTPALAQSGKDSATAPAGHFNTNHAHENWMGRNYRQEWNTPITVPVINLSKEHGGLTPLKKGGGKQTKSLRVEDAQGRQYTFRSIAKFITSKTLPGDLQSEAAADLVSDGVSASYPYAALSMSVLSEAAGVPHGHPRIVMIPDDPKLGEFQKEFGNLMALYEERLPDSVDKAYDTDEVMEKLEKDNDNRADQMAMLRVRILDMYVMDLDRHEGQWTWGSYDNGKGKTFYPIAKDRDQAFYINQGILPGIVKGKSLVPQLEGFKAKTHDITRFNFAARNLDRYFLNQPGEEDWKREAERMVSVMTDDVIEKALAQQPKEIRDISSAKIIQTLKDRRKYLVADVMQYYHFLAEAVNITGSDKKELYHVTRNDDGSVLVQVYKVSKDGDPSTKMYERKFDPAYTKEIRIYGFDGDDQFNVDGSNDKIKVRLIGGGGEDVFKNTAKNQSHTIVYDRKDGKNKLEGPFKNHMSDDSTVNKFQFVHYKYPLTTFFFTAGYNPDDGIYLGPTLKIVRHGFRKEPYKSMHQFKGLYAFSTGAVSIRYNNEFNSVFGKKTDLMTDVFYKGPDNTVLFFGYGMNSIYDKTKPDKFKFYRIRFDLGDISLQLRHRFSEKVSLSLGPTYSFYTYDSSDKFNKIRNVELNNASGLNQGRFSKSQSYIGATFNFLVDTRNSKAMPSKGIEWNTTFRYLSGNNTNSYDRVTQLNSDFSFYVSLVKNWLVWADRVGGGITAGKNDAAGYNDFEFFQAQTMGAEENLRGFRKERFTGRSKFYNQTELRLKLADLHTYLFPAAFGIYSFLDFGQVSGFKGNNPNGMATGYGGGLWFSPLKRIAFTLCYAKSKEGGIPMFSFAWKF